MDGKRAIQKAYESILAGDFEKAIEWFERAIELEPGNANYHYKLSITCARSNKLAKALEHADMARRLEPEDEYYRSHFQNLQAKELLQKAEKYFSQPGGQIYMAIAMLKQAVALDPLALEAFLLLALAYARTEDYGPAIQAVKEALKLDPQHQGAGQLLSEFESKFQLYIGGSAKPRSK
ncbi:tetratricopeptide repeat protein [Paenibacillus hamazuiensis]|uniref:tetratricopeptide repeat protein n=1 Tax=Paenibacillus hamazuiensis TaxID=2936508 RepID=UPI00200DF8FC|nr:tetratricopeptide repeat protein [Paenibacillus hamazuiensis]